MNKAQQNKEKLAIFTARWKTLKVCYDTTEKDVQSLRKDIEDFINDKDDTPVEFFMLLSDIEDWLVAHEEEFDDDESLFLTEDDVYRTIALSAFVKIKNECPDEEWDEDEEDTWLMEIVNMMIYLNNGDSNEVVAHKIFNEFLLVGFEVDMRDLVELVNLISSLCQQELLAVQIAEKAFDLGATPEIALARVREILSL